MVDEVRRQSKSRQEFRSRLAGGRVETESRRGDGGGVARGGKESLFSGRPLPAVCPPRTPEIGWHAYRGGVSCEIRFLEIRL